MECTSRSPRRSRPDAALLTALAALSACAPDASTPEGATGQQHQPVQADRRLSYYDVSLAPVGASAVAQRATGTVFTPQRDPVTGAQARAIDGTRLRYTCGVTFVGPSHAVTAGHCVTSEDVGSPPSTPVTVEMYSLSPSLDWTRAANLTGTWPNFTHPMMTADDGYVTERFTCRVAARCGTAWGPELNCSRPDGDVALLNCEGAPGEKYGYVNVATTEDWNWPLAMFWTHEVYNIPNDPADDRYIHYTTYPAPGRLGDNFHYFGDLGGVERNQLLQLTSIRFPDLTHRRRTGVDPYYPVVWTDLLGCHGTSGAGIMQRNGPTGALELLGPAALGNFDELCAERAHNVPGRPGLAYGALEHTSVIASPGTICATVTKAENPALWFMCHWRDVRCRDCLPNRSPISDPWPWDWPATDITRPYERLRVWNEPTVRVTPGAPVEIESWNFVPGVRYRLAFHANWPAGSPAPALALSLGAQPLVGQTAPAPDPQRPGLGVVSATFTVPNGGVVPLQVAAHAGSTTFNISDINIVREGSTDSFDTEDGRRGAGLLLPASPATPVEPMRFAGDGRGGFAAVLRAGERVVLTRQAFATGRNWLTSFRASGGTGGLTCGMMFADGSEAAASCAPSASGYAARTISPAASAQPIAFFVESAAGWAGEWRIDDVTLESCSAACGAPANGRATCANEACGTACDPGFVPTANGGCARAGDRCVDAIAIPMSEPAVDLRASNVGATHDATPSCASGYAGSGYADVFYRFTLTRPELVYADTFGASWDTVLFFANAQCAPVPVSPASPGGLLECNDDASAAGCNTGGYQSQVLGFFQPGTYYLVLQGYGAATGEATIHFRHQPVGNNGASAAPWPSPTLLSAGTSTVAGATSGNGLISTATLGLTAASLGDYACVDGGFGPENTYYWRTCPEAAGGAFTATSCNGQTGSDTYLYVSSPGQVAGNDCNDDNPACTTRPLSSVLPRPDGRSLQIAPGAGLHVFAVDSYSASSGGSYVVQVTRP